MRRRLLFPTEDFVALRAIEAACVRDPARPVWLAGGPPIRRRDFIALLGGAGAWPLSARAQQGERKRRIGMLLGSASENEPFMLAPLTAFRQGLRDLGWTEDRNLQIDIRGAAGDRARTQAYAAELVSLAPDLIVAVTQPAVIAVARLTATLPIIMVLGADPVASGLVASLARPSGNITGFSAQGPAISGKWLETLKDAAPRLTRVLILQNTANPNRNLYFPWIRDAARAHGMEVTMPEVARGDELAALFGNFAKTPNGGLIIIPGPFATSNRASIIELAARYRLPAVYTQESFEHDGGLISYGDDPSEIFQRSATYVDRFLRGARPSDLPFQLPNKIVMAINLSTAKALGLEVPPRLIALADEVIE